jgi:hypothetical protein
MRMRGALAIVVAALVVVGAYAAERVGSASPAPVPQGGPVSSTWLCPHGGGEGWTGVLALANPGTETVDVRITALGNGPPGKLIELTIPPGRQVQQEVPADAPTSSSFVEAFGGWVSAGWIVRAADPFTGIGAEPCATAGARTWYAAGASTEEGERSTLIVMNPYAEPAVFDVALFSSRPPLRDRAWSELVLGAHRSMALRIDRKLVGEPAVGAVVSTKVGRIGVATLGVSDGGGVRAVLGSPAPASTVYLPSDAGVGQSTLQVLVPGEDALLLAATLVSEGGAAPAGGLIDQEQHGGSAIGYPVATAGPSSIDVSTSAGAGTLAAAQRSTGQSADDAATGGVSAPGPAWIVPPTVVEQPSFPGLVLVNPNNTPVRATLQLIATRELETEPVSVRIPASSAVAAPRAFLAAAPQASVLVTADGDIVALGASTSSGVRGLSLYGLAVGVRVPAGVLATG